MNKGALEALQQALDPEKFESTKEAQVVDALEASQKEKGLEQTNKSEILDVPKHEEFKLTERVNVIDVPKTSRHKRNKSERINKFKQQARELKMLNGHIEQESQTLKEWNS